MAHTPDPFLKLTDHLIRLSDIQSVDIQQIGHGEIFVTLRDGTRLQAHDFEAFELILYLKPSAIEGKRLKHLKHAWAIHNLIGHPLMQIFAWCGLHKWAILIHDKTTPKVHWPHTTS
jgi:hypothetical protein